MFCSKSPKLHRTSTATLPPATTAEPILNNDDLLLEILLRLPIRSLLIFKSVSKRWLSLISNPNFSHRRSISRPLTPSGIFFPRLCLNSRAFDFVSLTAKPSRPPFESLNFTDEKDGVLILQSCNGLLLCSSCGNGSYSNRDYYVHNPTTKQFSKLPKLQPGTILGLNLAFDPSRSADYKVICVRASDSFTSNYHIEIYSSRTGPWRRSQGVFSAPGSMRFDCGVYWNGAVHWISTYENCFYLDLREGKIHELPMPRVPDGWEERQVGYFGNCGGNLHLIEIYEPGSLQLNVYEMEEGRRGWFVKYCVDLRCVSAAFPGMIPSEEEMELGFLNRFSVMAIVDDGIKVDEESYVVLMVDGGEVVRVKAKSGGFERLMEVDSGGDNSSAIVPVGFGRIDAYLYIESLAFV